MHRFRTVRITGFVPAPPSFVKVVLLLHQTDFSKYLHPARLPFLILFNANLLTLCRCFRISCRINFRLITVLPLVENKPAQAGFNSAVCGSIAVIIEIILRLCPQDYTHKVLAGILFLNGNPYVPPWIIITEIPSVNDSFA